MHRRRERAGEYRLPGACTCPGGPFDLLGGEVDGPVGHLFEQGGDHFHVLDGGTGLIAPRPARQLADVCRRGSPRRPGSPTAGECPVDRSPRRRQAVDGWHPAPASTRRHGGRHGGRAEEEGGRNAVPPPPVTHRCRGHGRKRSRRSRCRVRHHRDGHGWLRGLSRRIGLAETGWAEDARWGELAGGKLGRGLEGHPGVADEYLWPCVSIAPTNHGDSMLRSAGSEPDGHSRGQTGRPRQHRERSCELLTGPRAGLGEKGHQWVRAPGLCGADLVVERSRAEVVRQRLGLAEGGRLPSGDPRASERTTPGIGPSAVSALDGDGDDAVSLTGDGTAALTM